MCVGSFRARLDEISWASDLSLVLVDGSPFFLEGL
jgi:hypothetical protein